VSFDGTGKVKQDDTDITRFGRDWITPDDVISEAGAGAQAAATAELKKEQNAAVKKEVPGGPINEAPKLASKAESTGAQAGAMDAGMMAGKDAKALPENALAQLKARLSKMTPQQISNVRIGIIGYSRGCKEAEQLAQDMADGKLVVNGVTVKNVAYMGIISPVNRTIQHWPDKIPGTVASVFEALDDWRDPFNIDSVIYFEKPLTWANGAPKEFAYKNGDINHHNIGINTDVLNAMEWWAVQAGCQLSSHPTVPPAVPPATTKP
jgi:hypothetical protein